MLARGGLFFYMFIGRKPVYERQSREETRLYSWWESPCTSGKAARRHGIFYVTQPSNFSYIIYKEQNRRFDMIIISGSSFDISTIVNEYPENTIERQLLNMMSASTEEYQYDSLNVLKLDLRLRKEIIQSAKALNDSAFSFEDFSRSRCNPMYWERTEDGGFLLKESAKPGDAINDIFINGNAYATECATAIIIVYYKALLNVFEEERFNKQFPQIYLMGWESESLNEYIITVEPVLNMLFGDGGYFANPDFNPETPEWQGENVIALPDSMYYGHGIGIQTANEIIQALNAERKYGATQSAYITNKVNRLDVKKFADIYYGSVARTASLVWEPFPEPISASKIPHHKFF